MERYRTTLILLALLVGLGGLAMFLNNRGGTPDGTPTATPTQYVWQDENQVVAIEVVSGTNKVMVRKDITTTFWAVTEPVQKDADTFSVSSVADSLKSLEATAQLTGTTNLADFGLANPGMSATSTFSDTQGTKRVLMVGNATFDGSGYYVKTPDSATVYIVSNRFIEPLRTWLTTPPVAPPTATPFPATVVVTDTATVTGTVDITTTVEPATSPAVGTAAPATSPAATSETTPAVAATPSELPEASPAAGTPGPSLAVTATISGVSPITNTNTQPGAANPTTPVASPVIPSPPSPLATPAATPSP